MEAIATVFKAKFADLNDAQKAQAVEIMRDNQQSDSWWSESITEDLKERLSTEYSIHNAEIYWSGFGSQGDGASISTNYPIQLEIFLRKVKAWSKFRVLHKFIAEGSISAIVERNGHYYSHSNMVSGSVSFDWGVDYTQKQEAALNRLKELLTDVIRDLSDTLYRDLQKENDYQDSTEAITESINANDYEFEVIGGKVTKLL